MQAITIIMALIFMAFSGAAHATAEWGNTPTSCNPGKAKQWNGNDIPFPCHCPPKDEFCPKAVEIEAEDIEFNIEVQIVGQNERAFVIQGPDVPGLDPQTVFTLDEQALYELLAPVVDAELGSGTVIQDFVRNQDGTVWFFNIHSMVTGEPEGIEGWLEEYIKLPPDVAATCCDPICPEGFTPIEREYFVGRETCEDDCNDQCERKCTNCDVCINGEEEVCQTVKGQTQCTKVPCEEHYEETCDKTCEPICKIEDIVVEGWACQAIIKKSREGCLIEGTDVMLKDGTTKDIEDLKVGDEILGDSGTVKVEAINKFSQGFDTIYGVNGGEAFFTEEHPVMTKKGWKSVNPSVTKAVSGISVGPLVIGDEIMTKTGTITVKSIDEKPLENGVTVYNLKVSGNGAFVANEFIVKGFNNVEIQY